MENVSAVLPVVVAANEVAFEEEVTTVEEEVVVREEEEALHVVEVLISLPRAFILRQWIIVVTVV